MVDVLSEIDRSPAAVEALFASGIEAVRPLVYQLIAMVERLRQQLEQHDREREPERQELEELRASMKAIQDRLSKDSRTSSKPPSSDDPGPAPKSLREKTDRSRAVSWGGPGRPWR